MDLLRQLQHPVVRDLAWAVFSEDLMLAEAIDPGSDTVSSCRLTALTPARVRWLQALDQSPRPLLTHVEASVRRRLGLYFESLWHFFLRSEPAADLLASNLPVRDAGRTVGEFDCLYRCRDSGEIVHLELAVKFYLYTGPGTGAEADGRADWLGPGCRDRLDRKLNHMSHHQTRLSRHPEAQRLLRQRDLVPHRTEVAVKGRLFRRPDQPDLPPAGHNPRNSLLRWDHLERLPGLIDTAPGPGCHVILPRRYWLAPLAAATLDDADESLARRYDNPADLQAALSQHVAATRRPQVIATVDADQRETGRCFVAPASWPVEPGR